MKTILSCLGAALFLVIAPLRSDPILQPNDFVAICGDAITEQLEYSVFMEDYLLMCQPTPGLRAAPFGQGGDTAKAFSSRADLDVAPYKPSVATMCFGMNDGACELMTQTIGDNYRNGLKDAIGKLKAMGVRTIVVGSPGCVDPAIFVAPTKRSAEEYNKTLEALKDIAKEVATSQGLIFADIHTPMMDVMAKAKAAYGNKYLFVAGGGAFPEYNGQIVMAYAFLKALGCDGAIGTITVDLTTSTAQGTPGQNIVSCQNGTVDIESTRYAFCFPPMSNRRDLGADQVLKFFSFNDDLNRYLLVVKGLQGSKAKVTWGTETREFSAAALANGVNLAAEFLANPFCDQFKKVDAAVHAQQEDDRVIGTPFTHNLQSFKIMAPNSSAKLDKIAADAQVNEKTFFDKAAALVVPVHHTIKIEPEP